MTTLHALQEKVAAARAALYTALDADLVAARDDYNATLNTSRDTGRAHAAKRTTRNAARAADRALDRANARLNAFLRKE